jgi:glycine/D-amino acid oxidase-like deaminating enzyme
MNEGGVAAPAQTPYWWEAAPPPERSAAALPKRVDVAVVGAGFTGISTALTLARAGRHVLVLDGEAPGSGASRRNGGMIGNGHRVGFAALARLYGAARAEAILREGMNALAFTTGLIEAEGIDCRFRRCGRFRAAWTPQHYEAMARDLDHLHRLIGLEGEMVPAEAQHREVASARYHGGCVFTRHGGLHPGLLHQGLMDRAEQAGATVAGHAPVTAVRRGSAGFVVRTGRGDVAARDVILATNGYSGGAVPWLRRRIVPVTSYLAATEELGENRVRALIPGGRMIVETRARHCYYRPSPDRRRIVFGVRAALHRIDLGRAAAIVRRLLADLFPDLGEPALTHMWCGNVGMTRDQIPHVGSHDGLHYAAGFSGSGVAMAPYLGYKVALKVLADPDGATAFDDTRFRAVPFYEGHPWFLPFMSLYYDRADRREGSP